MVLELKFGEVVSEDILVREGFKKLESGTQIGSSDAAKYRFGNDLYTVCAIDGSKGQFRVIGYHDMSQEEGLRAATL